MTRKHSMKHVPAVIAAAATLSALAAACGSSETGKGALYGQLTADAMNAGRLATTRTGRSTLISSPTCDGSYRCSVSPSNYLMAYTRIELVKLTDTSIIDGEGIHQISADDIETATTITDSAIETDPAEFDIPADSAAELDHVSLADVSGEYDGVAVTYAYLQQELDSGTIGADAVDEWETYEICLQNGRCSNSDATIGDYLLQGRTAGWGFIEYAGCEFSGATSCSGYSIEAEKPADFSATDPVFGQGNVAGDNWFIVKDTGATLTSYRVFYPFEKSDAGSITQSIDEDSEITLTYSTANSFEWHDGAMMDATASGTQPAKVNSRGGSSNGDDTLSPSIFNPAHDNAFLPRLPAVSVAVGDAADTTAE